MVGTYTLTFGEQVEAFAGMETYGKLAESGFTEDEILASKKVFDDEGIVTEFHVLNNLLNVEAKRGVVLVIRNGAQCISKGRLDKIRQEVCGLKLDTQAIMRKRVVEKRARLNTVLADFSQEIDMAKGCCSVYNFANLQEISRIRSGLSHYFGEKALNLNGEINHYHHKDSFISPHGDGERKIVIGVRFGEEFPLWFQWYHKSQRVSQKLRIDLQDGDMYVMSDFARGANWKKPSEYSLRHSAGREEVLEKIATVKFKAMANKSKERQIKKIPTDAQLETFIKSVFTMAMEKAELYKLVETHYGYFDEDIKKRSKEIARKCIIILE